jgi:hypothetical protein
MKAATMNEKQFPFHSSFIIATFCILLKLSLWIEPFI